MRASDAKRGAAAIALVAGLVGVFSPAAAQQRDEAEARLRAQLRSTTVQLRQLEDQHGALQAKQAEAERDKQALTQQLAASEQELAELREKLKSGEQALQQSSGRLQSTSAALVAERANLAKSQAAYQQAAEAARSRDAEAKRLDAALAEMRKRVLTAETKNAELYRLGTELLQLYDKKGVLETLGSKEPFTRLKRVELENLMQDYKDRLSDSRLVRPPQ